MKIKSANGLTGCLIYCADQVYRIRIYADGGDFIDYDIQHNDLLFTICDEDAYLYSNNDRFWIDHSTETLGLNNENSHSVGSSS
jgi:hypothetical protein